MKTNKPVHKPPIHTHEGGVAKRITPLQQLRRLVLACMLFEDNFYVDGQESVALIEAAVAKVTPDEAMNVAIEARSKGNLRHAPLFVARVMAKLKSHRDYVAQTLAKIIQRVDEIPEFLALYFRDKKDQPLASQVKKGIAKAFTKFDEYQLGKYNRDGLFTLKDALFLSHAKPKDTEQAMLWKKLIGGFCEKCWHKEEDHKPPVESKKKKKVVKRRKSGDPCSNYVEAKMAIPDTWETELSAGKDKKATFTRLIKEKKLFAMALLRNLRNMQQAGVDDQLIRKAIVEADVRRVLPFRFIAAARFAPAMEDVLEQSLFKCTENMQQLKGKTIILVDVSGSMQSPISAKSDMSCRDAACGVAMICREICEQAEIFAFSDFVVKVPNRRGFALRDAITQAKSSGGTALGAAVTEMNGHEYDRLIVFTDEQSRDRVPDPRGMGYMVNVQNHQNGVGYGKFVHIDGFSESVIHFISEYENMES